MQQPENTQSQAKGSPAQAFTSAVRSPTSIPYIYHFMKEFMKGMHRKNF